jgi:hypothetical protein
MSIIIYLQLSSETFVHVYPYTRRHASKENNLCSQSSCYNLKRNYISFIAIPYTVNCVMSCPVALFVLLLLCGQDTWDGLLCVLVDRTA